MPWIIKHDDDVYEAAEVYTDERITEVKTFDSAEPDEYRSPRLHMNAVIAHAPSGRTTPMQHATLRNNGPYEITWQEESWTT